LFLFSGSRTKWKEKESSLGQMVENTKDSIRMTKSMDSGLLTGRMVVNLRDNGLKGSNMERVNTETKKALLDKDFGRMGPE
jgi:hypothetical protein